MKQYKKEMERVKREMKELKRKEEDWIKEKRKWVQRVKDLKKKDRSEGVSGGEGRGKRRNRDKRGEGKS